MSHLWYHKLKLASLIITSYSSRSLALLFPVLPLSLNVLSIISPLPFYQVVHLESLLSSGSMTRPIPHFTNTASTLRVIVCLSQLPHKILTSLMLSLLCIFIPYIIPEKAASPKIHSHQPGLESQLWWTAQRIKEPLTQALVWGAERFKEMRKGSHHSNTNP